MKIADDHLYYGAAIIQIAEHKSFTAINGYKENDRLVECAYQVNGDIGVYLKYRTVASRTTHSDGKPVAEYEFHFNTETQGLLDRLQRRYDNVFIGLVCADSREICCITMPELRDLLQRRIEDAGNEKQITVYLSLREGSAFRAFVVPSGTRRRILGNPLTISRLEFPRRIFNTAD